MLAATGDILAGVVLSRRQAPELEEQRTRDSLARTLSRALSASAADWSEPIPRRDSFSESISELARSSQNADSAWSDGDSPISKGAGDGHYSPHVGVVHQDSYVVSAGSAATADAAGRHGHTRPPEATRRDKPPSDPIELSWEISLTVKTTAREAATLGKTKKVLADVVGTVKSGQLLAVMGSSGAGKSSFLDCVSLRNQSFDGHVFVNNKPADQSFYFMTGFVYQEDLFIPTMTVREHLTFHAMVRMDANVSVSERLDRVQDVLVEVALTHCPDTIIGGAGTGFRGISGGEKKRLAFGTELLNDPSIIFADEPTSGLDSFMTRGVCTTMRRLVDDGKVIMCVIHQPSSQTFDLFTHLLLLAKGRIVYQGLMSELHAYFSALGLTCPRFHNPADYLIQQVSIVPSKVEESTKKLNRLLIAYAESELCARNMGWKKAIPADMLTAQRNVVSMTQFHASTRTQFYYTMKRNVENQFRQETEVQARFMNAVVMGLILGTIYFQQTDSQQSAKSLMGLFFLLVMFQVMTSMFGVLQVFPSEVKVFVRENLSGANRVTSYFLARTLSELPNTIIYPVLLGAIVYGMVHLQPTASRYYFFHLVIVLVANCAASLGYMISAMTSHEAVAYALAPLFLMPMALFAGLLLDLNQIPAGLRWLDFFSIIRYGYQLLIINQYRGTDLSCVGSLFCRWPTGEKVMAYIGTTEASAWGSVGCLVALIVIFRTLALTFLWLKSRRAGH